MNDVKIIGWSPAGRGVIFVLDDYLFTEHIEEAVEPINTIPLQAFPREYTSDNEIEGQKEEKIPKKTTTTTEVRTL